jgi:hypothetical protein
MKSRYLKPLGVATLILSGVLGANGGVGWAQDQPVQPLVIYACDPARPVLFQPLAPDTAPDPAAFVSTLELPLAPGQTTPVVYVAVRNTGWSEGAVGLIDSGLSPDETYIALEVRSNGAGSYTLRQDGRGLAFPLHYVADLDGEGTPGFRLDMLVGQMALLRLYRVAGTGGVSLRATTNVRGTRSVVAQRATYVVNPDAVLGGLVFEVHIAALPIPQPALPMPTPSATTASASATPIPESEG